MTRRRARLAAFVVPLALAGMAGSPAFAKGPTLTGLFPPGAARGGTTAVTASGSFDRWPVSAWVEGEGVAIEAGGKKGELKVRVSADAEPGLRWVRLYDGDGASALRPFVVGTVPEVVEAEPNDDPGRAQAVPGPSATVNGRLARSGDVDGFSVTLRRGETLVADVAADRHLGSPMDAVLQVATPSGIVLAQNDDAVGRDPRVVFEAPADGSYVVRVFAFPATPDSSIRFAGGPAFVYRLTLTTGGFLDLAFPLAVSRDGPAGAEVEVEAVGPNVPEPARRLNVSLSANDGRDVRRVGHPLLAGTAEVRVVAGPAAVESEPDDPTHPQEIPDRVALSGRIDPPGDRDTFRVALKKGDRRTFRVESRSLGFPLDAVLRLTDAGGKTLAESDDVRQDRDPRLSFTAPADGEYRVTVRDLNGRGGPRFAYLLRVLAPDPDVSLTLASDRVDVTPGKLATLTVTVDRADGFSGTVEVSAEGLPAGVSASPARSEPKGESAKTVKLTLKAEDTARSGPFRIVGKAEGVTPPRVATAPVEGFSARADQPWLTVHPAAPAGQR